MWQMCAYIPTTLPRDDQSLQVLPAQLSSSFLLETFIHAKEKPTMVQWIELLTKQFNQCHSACEVCHNIKYTSMLVWCVSCHSSCVVFHVSWGSFHSTKFEAQTMSLSACEMVLGVIAHVRCVIQVYHYARHEVCEVTFFV